MVAASSCVVLGPQYDQQQQVEDRKCKESGESTDDAFVVSAVANVILAGLVECCGQNTRTSHSERKQQHAAKHRLPALYSPSVSRMVSTVTTASNADVAACAKLNPAPTSARRQVLSNVQRGSRQVTAALTAS